MNINADILRSVYRNDNPGLSLLDVFPQVLEHSGFSDQTALIMDNVLASEITSAPTPAIALENSYYACKKVISAGGAYNLQDWMSVSMDSFLKTGGAKGWTVDEIMAQLNRIVGQQHSLDGKLFEACIIMTLTHFLGKGNVEFKTQQATGSDFGGHSDIEVWTRRSHFLVEATTRLGSNWKRYVVEHWVPVTDDHGNVTMEHQPYFLVTPGFNLKERWLSAMDKVKCQAVSIRPSVLMGVAHFDAFVDALKREIEKERVADQTQTV